MRRPKSHNIRILELYKNDRSFKDISKIIYEEYGILKTVDNIQKSVSSKKVIQINSYHSKVKKTNITLISDVLKLKSYPLNSQEISNFIYKSNNIRLSRKEINKIVYQSMKTIVVYDRDTYTYSLVKNELTKEDRKKEVNSEFDEKVKNYSTHFVFETVKKFFKDNLIEVSTGNEKLDYIVKSIVKDNVITKCEEDFLINKAKEFGFSQDIIKKAKEHIESNNPYLDNLIDLVFDDGIISDEELFFLDEKTKENNFSDEFVSKRFWLIGFSKHLSSLLKIKGFEKVVKLIFIYISLDLKNESNDIILFSKLDVFSNSSINEITNEISNSLEQLTRRLLAQTNKVKKIDSFIDEVFDKIKLETNIENKENNHNQLHLSKIINIVNEEKRRLGSPSANLLAENILFRLEQNKL